MDEDELIDVVVTLPLPHPLTYRLPPELGPAPVGAAVRVPVGRRQVVGYVWGPAAAAPDAALKPITAILDPAPRVGPEMAGLFQWLAEYYHYPLGEVLRTAIPDGGGHRRPREEQWVGRVTPSPPPPSRLGPKARDILSYLEEAGVCALGELARPPAHA